jgi:hypothetical protein
LIAADVFKFGTFFLLVKFEGAPLKSQKSFQIFFAKILKYFFQFFNFNIFWLRTVNKQIWAGFIDIEIKNRLLKVSYVLATRAASSNVLDDTNKAGGACHS